MPRISEQRKPLYSQLEVVIRQGDTALTYDEAVEILGWEVQEKKDAETSIKNHDGQPVRFSRNAFNRPFSTAHALRCKQDHLNRMWKLNLENVVIGEYGNVLSGQHRLAGYILAVEEWRADPEAWSSEWETEPVYECSIAYGVKETPEVIRTFDNVKARTFADVLHTSPDFFGKRSPKERARLSRILSTAIRVLWKRIGRKYDERDSKLTHSEAAEWLARHDKLKKAVLKILELHHDGAITPLVNMGVASALFYLMASSETDGDRYRKNPSERRIDFSMWDKAMTFWAALASDTPLRSMLSTHCDTSLQERIALIVKAWNVSLVQSGFTDSDLALSYYQDSNGVSRLDEYPMVGGIDYAPDETTES